MDRSALRRECIKNRNAVPEEVRRKKSARICAEIFSVLRERTGEGALAAAYYPLGSEVDIRMIYPMLEETGIILCLPVMIRDFAGTGCEGNEGRDEMRFFSIPYEMAYRGEEDFMVHPASALSYTDDSLKRLKMVEADRIDACIVPMAGFNGTVRLGYGGGNYDRFLPKLRKDALIIGAAFDEQYHQSVTAQAHDFAIPLIIHF